MQKGDSFECMLIVLLFSHASGIETELNDDPHILLLLIVYGTTLQIMNEMVRRMGNGSCNT